MSIFTAAQNAISNNILNPIANAANDIAGMVGSTSGRVVDDVKSLFTSGTTVVGINVNKIEPMKTAIRDYCKAINDEIGKIQEVDPEKAFKGSEIVPALKANNKAVIDMCTAIVSNMLAFNDMLTQVQEAYEKKDKTNSELVNENVSAQQKNIHTYTEGKGAATK